MATSSEFRTRGKTILTKYLGSGGDVIIPDGITTIAEGAFKGAPIISVTIPDSVTQILKDAFLGCTTLEWVRLPAHLTRLGSQAFYNCSALTAIELPQGLPAIEYGTFLHCKNLSTVSIPDSVEEIGRDAFTSTSLEAVAMSKAAFDRFRATSEGEIATNTGLGIAVRDGGAWFYYGYAGKLTSNNLCDLWKGTQWNAYDLELINNGPVYKYKASARLLGALGRLVDPVELTDECKELHLEFLIKNAKKLIPIAEQLRCPAIVEAMKEHGIINDKNKKAIAKLLAASEVPEIAAVAL